MNLSDFFPVEAGQVITKQHVNILIAALKERTLKMSKFVSSNSTSLNPFLIAAANTNTNDSTQSYLDYFYDNIVNSFDLGVPTHPLQNLVFSWLPYEDMFINGYKVNQNQRKYIWDALLSSTGGYKEKDVVFSIKDASLYFLSDGKWVQDNGKIIMINNDKTLLRILNELNQSVRGMPVFTDGPDTVFHDTDTSGDILDTLYYFKNFRDDAFGGKISHLDGAELFPSETALNRSVTICAPATTENAHVLSPYLIYSSLDKNNKSSITTKENSQHVYKWRISSTDNLEDINENYIFGIDSKFDPDVVNNLFPFIATDYFLSYILNSPALGDVDQSTFILYKNNSYTNPQPNFTASLMNAIYYLVDYYKYLKEGINGGDSSGSSDPDLNCFGAQSANYTTILASFSQNGSRQGVRFDCSPICCPGTVFCCCNTINTTIQPIGNDCLCGFGANSSFVTAGATVIGDCAGLGSVTAITACSLTSDKIVWFNRCQGINFQFLQGYNPGASILVFLTMESVLNIK